MATAIDCLVNVGFADEMQPEWMVRVKEDYFKGDDSFFQSPELPELLENMDANGVRRAVLMTRIGAVDDRAQRYAAAEPDRFALAVGGLNLLKPMKALRGLESFVRDNPVAYTVVGPSFWGDAMYPPGDAVYYPLYTKCCELDLPLCMNTGLPGPPIPGEVTTLVGSMMPAATRSVYSSFWHRSRSCPTSRAPCRPRSIPRRRNSRRSGGSALRAPSTRS